MSSNSAQPPQELVDDAMTLVERNIFLLRAMHEQMQPSPELPPPFDYCAAPPPFLVAANTN